MKALKLGNRRCECPTCGECFNSVHAFEIHRVECLDYGRRCLNKMEMLAKGMVENDGGYWVSSLREVKRDTFNS